MKDQIVNLNTLDLRGITPSLVDTRVRALKKRVFTDDQIRYLNSLSTKELLHRIIMGDVLISLLYHPEMLNMTQEKADMISSNLRFQQDFIREIIKGRKQ